MGDMRYVGRAKGPRVLADAHLLRSDIVETYANLSDNLMQKDKVVLNKLRLMVWNLSDVLVDTAKMPSFDDCASVERLRAIAGDLKDLITEVPLL